MRRPHRFEGHIGRKSLRDLASQFRFRTAATAQALTLRDDLSEDDDQGRGQDDCADAASENAVEEDGWSRFVSLATPPLT